MEPVALGFTAVLVMGFVFGAGPCNIACLPYLGPIFLSPVRPWREVAAFSTGRIAGYVGMAAAAGTFGHVATRMLEGPVAGIVLGLAALAAGLVMLFKRRRRSCGASSVSGAASDNASSSKVEHSLQRFERKKRRDSRTLPVALFGMGLGMALNPCTPLATVLLAAAASASLWGGAWLGFGFGLGAVVLPALVFGWLMARFGLEVRTQVGRWRSRLEQGAGVMLLVLGVFTMMGWVHP